MIGKKSTPAQLKVRTESGQDHPVPIPAETLAPMQARELAAALLRAADEAEGVHPSQAVFSARQHVRDTWIAGNGPEAFSAALNVLEHAVREDERSK